MKIYKRQAFLTLPAGVIFSKGGYWYFDSLMVKGDTLQNREGKNIDFGYKCIVNIDSKGGPDWVDKLETC